jgi:lipid-A-disaccharide synthase
VSQIRQELQDLRLTHRPSVSRAPLSLLSPPERGGVDLLVIAGEHSGDEHAARLVRDLRRSEPMLTVAALGGPALQGAGAQLLHDLTASSVVGVVEVLKHYRYFRTLLDETAEWVERYRPRAVLLVDYPGFNLRLAARLRERGVSAKGGGPVKLLYYISPQIWAWKARRRFTMARDLDALATIFPFEPACYADTTLKVEFVGHPFLAPDYRPPVRYDPSAPVLLLPGSRRQAVERIFPRLLAGFAASGLSRAQVLHPSPLIESVLRAAHPPASVSLVPTGAEIAASAVLTSSGTMSLHCALAGIPGAIVYRANPLTYLLGRCLLRVPYLGIANLLLNEEVYPEFLQGAAAAEPLGEELKRCTRDPARIADAQRTAQRLRDILRSPADAGAALWVLRQMGR